VTQHAYYFMTVIDGVFCVWYTETRRVSILTGVR